MPYADAWVNTSPAGSVDANKIDDEFRKLRNQLKERFEDFLVEDWTADPIVVKASFGTGISNTVTTGIVRIIPFAAFLNDLHAKENNITVDGYVVGFCGSGPWIAPLDVPVGCTITNIEWLIDKTDAAFVNCQLYSKQFAAPSASSSSMNTIAVSEVGLVVKSSGVLSITVLADRYYFLAVTGSGPSGNSFKLFACRITFDRDSLAHAS